MLKIIIYEYSFVLRSQHRFDVVAFKDFLASTFVQFLHLFLLLSGGFLFVSSFVLNPFQSIWDVRSGDVNSYVRLPMARNCICTNFVIDSIV